MTIVDERERIVIKGFAKVAVSPHEDISIKRRKEQQTKALVQLKGNDGIEVLIGEFGEYGPLDGFEWNFSSGESDAAGQMNKQVMLLLLRSAANYKPNPLRVLADVQIGYINSMKNLLYEVTLYPYDLLRAIWPVAGASAENGDATSEDE